MHIVRLACPRITKSQPHFGSPRADEASRADGKVTPALIPNGIPPAVRDRHGVAKRERTHKTDKSKSIFRYQSSNPLKFLALQLHQFIFLISY
ncbi:hypothetical protein CHELA20_11263 [Hyphomicrobiales bacterium]|nr:hypothetical protein CHELA20_11263 [Hyphomicrobiales bacterium]CAH1695475.1 hypothetical protein CHELA41_51511 [Hyphomicrobiales bacterium]